MPMLLWRAMREPALKQRSAHDTNEKPRRIVEIAGGGAYPIALEGFPFLACGLALAGGAAQFGHP